MCTSVDEAAAVMTGSGISGSIYFTRVGPNNISINTTDLLGLNGLYMYTPIEKTAADLPLSRIIASLHIYLTDSCAWAYVHTC